MKTFPQGLGLWISSLRNCDEGDIHQIVRRCKDCNIGWIAIKSGNSHMTEGFENVIEVILDIFHANNIKVYTYNYSKPSSFKFEIDQIKSLVKLGIDGHILDTGLEWQVAENNRALANEFLSSLRSEIGDMFLAYSTFAIVELHKTFPFREFLDHCDVVMPHAHWTEFGWSLSRTVKSLKISWDTFFNAINLMGGVNKPVYPVGITYGKGYHDDVEGELNQKDIVSFIKHYKDLPISLYCYDAASKSFNETFDTLATLNKLEHLVYDLDTEEESEEVIPSLEEEDEEQEEQEESWFDKVKSYVKTVWDTLINRK